MTDNTGGEPGADVETLAQSLLTDPWPEDDEPGARWAHPRLDMVVISLFIAYHVSVILVANLPSTGLVSALHWFFTHQLQMTSYLQATGSHQDWGLFAPDPGRTNVFLRVIVEDREGRLLDLGHDIYGRRRYPYLVYDRMGKINRRLVEDESYREVYAGWVCRDWEATHGGVPARAVRLQEIGTRIPRPEHVYDLMGYDPRTLPIIQGQGAVFGCAEIPHGQLPNSLRARLGLPPAPPDRFRPITATTWRTERTRGGTPGALEAPPETAPPGRVE